MCFCSLSSADLGSSPNFPNNRENRLVFLHLQTSTVACCSPRSSRSHAGLRGHLHRVRSVKAPRISTDRPSQGLPHQGACPAAGSAHRWMLPSVKTPLGKYSHPWCGAGPRAQRTLGISDLPPRARGCHNRHRHQLPRTGQTPKTLGSPSAAALTLPKPFGSRSQRAHGDHHLPLTLPQTLSLKRL